MGVATRTSMVFSPVFKVVPRSMRVRSAWFTLTAAPLTFTVAESSTSPRSRYALSLLAHVDGSVTVVEYVPMPEDCDRSPGVVMSRQDGSFPLSPAESVTDGWSVLTVVYWFSPGVHVCAFSVHELSGWAAVRPVTAVVRCTPLLSVVAYEPLAVVRRASPWPPVEMTSPVLCTACIPRAGAGAAEATARARMTASCGPTLTWTLTPDASLVYSPIGSILPVQVFRRYGVPLPVSFRSSSTGAPERL